MANFQHLSIPNNRAHPWKGADYTQPARSIYVADGAGSGRWTPLAAGQIYFSGTSTLTTPTTYTRFAPATFVASGYGGAVAVEGDDELTWTAEATPVLISWSITLEHTNAAAQRIYVALAPAAGTTGYLATEQSSTAAQNKKRNISGCFLKTLSYGDAYSLWVKVAAGNITVYRAQINMVKVF